MADARETLRQSQALMAASRFSEAVQLLENATQQLPADFTVALGLGIARQASGQVQAAVTAYNRAIELNSTHVETWCRLAAAHQQLKQPQPATKAYEQALRLAPAFAEAACNLGGLYLELGRAGDAIDVFRRALTHKPQFPEAQNGLGIALKTSGQLSEAIAAFQHALASRPQYAEALFNLGNTFQALERWTEAIESYQKALRVGPPSADVFNNLGTTFWNARQFEAALVAHQKAIALKPDSAEAHNNLGNDFLSLGQLAEAAAAFRQAASLRPGYREAWCNLGNVFLAQNRTDEAIAAYRRANSNTPFPDATYNEALALLLSGNFAQGLPKYESRWTSKSSGLQTRGYTQPRWQGEDLTDRTILLHSEQGLGDTLQFVRYVPLVAQRGARVILCVQPPLKNLLATLPGVTRLQTHQDPLPPFDFHCPLLSLPLAFGTELTTIPANVPYLRAPADKSTIWQNRLAALPGFKIGLVCSGNPNHRNDHNRSVPLAVFAPLAKFANCPLFLIQKDFKPADTATLTGNPAFNDLSSELSDFSDTAAIIANMDLVISVDTSVVHLAGALGKPVWTLLPFAPDWRWLLDRNDSPWYSTMRLFRQPSPGEWAPVVEELSSALRSQLDLKPA